MKRTNWMVGPACFVLLLGLGIAPAAAQDHAFVGSDKCKMCHNSEAKGAQYKQWAGTLHAKAFLTLATPKAREIAKAKGIEDPTKASECLKCHQTGHNAPAAKLTDKYRADEGVGCESCHGAGGDYWKMDVMKDRTKALAAGLVVPTEQLCKTCHNPESPTYVPFEFKTFWAKVLHPRPKK